MDREFEKYIQDILAESTDEDEEPNESDKSEVDEVNNSDHDSASEQEAETLSDENSLDEIDDREYYIGKNGMEWYTEIPNQNVRISLCNIITHLPGPKDSGHSVRKPADCFDLMINTEILDLIKNYTNIYIDSIREKFGRERDANYTNNTEVKALIGLLFHAGMLKSARLNTKVYGRQMDLRCNSCFK